MRAIKDLDSKELLVFLVQVEPVFDRLKDSEGEQTELWAAMEAYTRKKAKLKTKDDEHPELQPLAIALGELVIGQNKERNKKVSELMLKDDAFRKSVFEMVAFLDEKPVEEIERMNGLEFLRTFEGVMTDGDLRNFLGLSPLLPTMK